MTQPPWIPNCYVCPVDTERERLSDNVTRKIEGLPMIQQIQEVVRMATENILSKRETIACSGPWAHIVIELDALLRLHQPAFDQRNTVLGDLILNYSEEDRSPEKQEAIRLMQTLYRTMYQL